MAVWSTDVHATQYAPVEVPDSAGGEPLVVRASKLALAEGIALHMVALFGDLDDPIAHSTHTPARDEWRAEVEARLTSSGMAWYRTRGGARVVLALPDAVEVRSEADERAWWDLYLAFVTWAKATHDLDLDPRCKDCWHLFRLPNVMRDDKPQRAELHGTIGAADLSAIMAHAAAQTTAPRTTPTAHRDDARMTRALTMAERLPPSIEGCGGDAALYHAATEIMSVLGSDRDAIREALDTYNARCLPPWPATKLDLEASRAASRHDPVTSSYAARLEARATGAAPQGAPVDVSCDPVDEFESAQGTLLGELEPRSFLVPELEIGVGRPYGWLGKSNASKTIAAMQLEIDLALGRPVFGRFDGPGHPVPVLRLAYEGFAKAREDYRRIINGTGEAVDLEALDRCLRFVDGQQLRRYITGNPSDNYEWLMRATAKFSGGLCVIDPLVAACLGLDENSAEIALPLCALEQVSRENNVTFLLAHHFGHEKARARGSSAIEAVFGASCAIAKDDETGSMTLERQATQHKRDRYGFEPFILTIRDVNADGTAFVPTSEDRKAQRASWGLRIEAKAANAAARQASGTPRSIEKFKTERAAAESNADRVIELLAAADTLGQGMTAHKIRTQLGMNQANWQKARDVLLRRGVVKEVTLPSESHVRMCLAAKGEGTPSPRLPQSGDVARTGRR